MSTLSSDEEGEDTDVLLYLPVSPEIEEADEGWTENQVSDELLSHF